MVVPISVVPLSHSLQLLAVDPESQSSKLYDDDLVRGGLDSLLSWLRLPVLTKWNKWSFPGSPFGNCGWENTSVGCRNDLLRSSSKTPWLFFSLLLSCLHISSSRKGATFGRPFSRILMHLTNIDASQGLPPVFTLVVFKHLVLLPMVYFFNNILSQICYTSKCESTRRMETL